MSKSKFSAEHRKRRRRLICPRCNRKSEISFIYPDYSGPPGHPEFNERTIVKCDLCSGTWMLFEGAVETLQTMEVRDIVETVRREEPIGEELRKIDNSATLTSSVRRLRITKHWTQKCEIQIEQATSTTIGVSAKPLGNLFEFESSLVTAVRKNYAMSTEEDQVFEEELEVSIPPRTAVHLRLRWKRLWQEGYLVVRDNQPATIINVPFRNVIGITFDQESIDS